LQAAADAALLAACSQVSSLLASCRTRRRTACGRRHGLVSDRDDAEFTRSMATPRLNVQAVDQLTGLDYSAGGGNVVLILYDLEPD
jgi:hypothetical protein